ncbi:MAG TPA: AsnC family transcriptional regulator [Candidatus Bathyarchaeota archaeon]|nr:AsnC family transcriptional regulator [Candidatus Bathyarchaeota archaeon]
MSSTKKIDEIDAKILKDLLKDGRKNFTEIAKEVGVSKNIIWQHYKKMKAEGIIAGSTIKLKYANLGYNTMVSLFVNVQPQKQNQILRRILKIPNVYSVTPLKTGSDLWVVATLKNNEELDCVNQSIKKLPSVISVRTEVWTGIRNTLEHLTVLSTNKTSAKTYTTKIQASNNTGKTTDKIDEIDLQIIEKLIPNGRQPFRKIAKELKISTDTVSRRFRKLKQNGTIKPTIQIDPIKLGYYALAYFRLEFVSQQNLSEIIETLAKIPDLEKIIKTSGSYDVCLFAMIRNIEQFIAIQDKIVAISGIRKIHTVVQKITYSLPVPGSNMSTF